MTLPASDYFHSLTLEKPLSQALQILLSLLHFGVCDTRGWL
jgi:hypothetical protein